MRCRSTGFTLVEMMVTVVVLAILSSIGFQAYQSIVVSIRMSGEINSLLGTLAFARSEALKRGQKVSVCPSPSPTAATNTCTNSTAWSTGWVVLPSSTAPLPLQISNGLTGGYTLTSIPTSVGAVAYPTFSSAGYTFFVGKLRLTERTNNANLNRCIVFSAGSWSTMKGAANCP